jgi:hypothetical protein
MNRSSALRVLAVVAVITRAWLASACDSSSNTTTDETTPATGDASTDGGGFVCANPVSVDPAGASSSPTGCPYDEPEAGARCSPSGLVCHGYGPLDAPVTATCSSTCVWSQSQAFPLGVDAGGDH